MSLAAAGRLRSLVGAVALGAGRRADLAVCGALTVVSAALRGPALGPSSYFDDEAWVALSARADSIGEFVRVGLASPLFNHAVGVMIRVFGEPVLVGQALPFIAGSVFAGVSYWGLRALELDRFASLAACLIAVFAPTHILYSAILRHYTVEVLLVGVLMYLAIQIIRGRGRGRASRAYVTVAAAGVLTSATVALTALPVLAAVFVIRSVDHRRIDRTVGACLAGLAAASAAYYMFYLRPLVPDLLRESWRLSYINTDSLSGFLESLRLRTSVAFGAFLPHANAWWIVAASAAVAVRRRWRELLVFAAPALATILMSMLELAPFGGEVGIVDKYNSRVDLHLMAGLVGVVALVLDEFRRSVPSTRSVAAIGVSAAVAVAGIVSYEEHSRWRPDVRPLVALLEQEPAERHDSPAVIANPLSRFPFAFYTNHDVQISGDDSYFNGFTADIADPAITLLEVQPTSDFVPTDPSQFAPQVATAVRNRTVVWFLGSLFPALPTDGDFQIGPIRSMIESEGFTETERHETTLAILIKYEKSGPGADPTPTPSQ